MQNVDDTQKTLKEQPLRWRPFLEQMVLHLVRCDPTQTVEVMYEHDDDRVLKAE